MGFIYIAPQHDLAVEFQRHFLLWIRGKYQTNLPNGAHSFNSIRVGIGNGTIC
jgi:hypothetical protein